MRNLLEFLASNPHGWGNGPALAQPEIAYQDDAGRPSLMGSAVAAENPDDSIIDILKKYGLAGLMAGGAGAFNDPNAPERQ